ncbi:hypothetical protein Desaci_0799 [Desulfosporosinus acidiphilus SJ4]|uniref:Uncharacterized protein n=1 Tax=Desulfosporosinus acidiphilus (strain DSM 22704 / JCM 16185 / SJ4) TaxID=646529 RepID=I4D235_DESAJ|nr:hypothetical protein Desaci_0799 [Desulfosporosinus acidiphilus SJ4]
MCEVTGWWPFLPLIRVISGTLISKQVIKFTIEVDEWTPNQTTGTGMWAGLLSGNIISMQKINSDESKMYGLRVLITGHIYSIKMIKSFRADREYLFRN